MNRNLIDAAIVGLVLVLEASAAGAQVSMPHRRPGMWETTIPMAGQVMKTGLCIDAATDARMTMFGQQSQTARCGHPPTLVAVPGGFSFHNECNGRVTSGTAIGDFNKAYTVTIEGRTHFVMTSRWLGPCPAGRKPGDMVMPDGTVMNINTIQ